MFDLATPHSHLASGNRRRRLVASISATLDQEETEYRASDYAVSPEDQTEIVAGRSSRIEETG